MSWIMDRKIVYLIVLAIPFLLCMTSARADATGNNICLENGHLDIFGNSEIADTYIPASTPKVGAIEKMVGDVIVLRQDQKSGYKAQQGDQIHQGDTIFTFADSTLRLTFKNSDVAIMGACANLHIDTYLDDRQNHKKTARYKSSKGNIMFYVLRLLGYRDIKFEVETPSRVASVRGTKFGISTIGTEGNHLKWLFENAPMNHEGSTDCFCDSGAVEIDEHMVSEGHIYKGNKSGVSLFTIKDRVKFQKQFRSLLTPYVMNTNSSPDSRDNGDDTWSDQSGIESDEDAAEFESDEDAADDSAEKSGNDDGNGKGKGHDNHDDDHPGKGDGHDKYD